MFVGLNPAVKCTLLVQGETLSQKNKAESVGRDSRALLWAFRMHRLMLLHRHSPMLHARARARTHTPQENFHRSCDALIGHWVLLSLVKMTGKPLVGRISPSLG